MFRNQTKLKSEMAQKVLNSFWCDSKRIKSHWVNVYFELECTGDMNISSFNSAKPNRFPTLEFPAFTSKGQRVYPAAKQTRLILLESRNLAKKKTAIPVLHVPDIHFAESPSALQADCSCQPRWVLSSQNSTCRFSGRSSSYTCRSWSATDDQLPDIGVSLELKRVLFSMFIKSRDYASRCSAILLAD